MAPADINLSQTRRWLAQLHTTNLPPASSSSSCSSSSMHSRGSADYSPGASSSTSSPTDRSAPVGGSVLVTPLTESRARSLQRLCEMGDAHNAIPASAVNARFAPSNINYIKTTTTAGESFPASPLDAAASSPTKSRWARKPSGQSLEALEGGAMRRFSMSRFKLR